MTDASWGRTETALPAGDAASEPGADTGGVPGSDPGAPQPDATGADPREAILEHLPALRAFALSLARDGATADDMVQEAVLKAWSKFHLFTPGTNLRAWLFTILRNSLNSQRRKRRREVPDSDGAMAARLASKPDHDGRLALSELAAALGELPVEQREALILVGAMGFTVEEAAETCGCAPGTIKSRANRGRRALARLLGLDADDDMTAGESVTLAVLTSPEQPG